MIKNKLLTLVTILIIPLSIKAQDTLCLTLDSAVNYAVNYNLVLKNAGLAIEEANKKVWEATSSGLPQLNASVDYSNFMGAEIEIQFDESMPSSTIPFKPTSNLKLTANQLIFSGNYFMGVQLAKLYEETTRDLFEKTRQDIIVQVSKAYYLSLVAENSKVIIEKTLKNIKDVYKKTEALVKVGITEETDLDQLSVQVTMLENTLQATKRQVELSYNMLRLHLGIDPEINIKLSDSIDEILTKIDFYSVLSSSFNIADNLDYKLIRKQELVLEKQVKMEKINYLPTIIGFYSYTEKLLKPDFDMTPKNVIGLQANIPIFSSGQKKSKVDQAKIKLHTGQNNKELVDDQLRLQEKQLRFNLNTAIEQYESQKKNVEVSDRVYQNIRLKYEQGLVSSLDLTAANNNYLQAETNYIQSLIQLLESEINLKQLYGKL